MSKTPISKMKRKQILVEAEAVASAHCMVDIVPGSACLGEQGMFSHTVTVTLVNDDKVVVQLKDNEIDTTKVALANSLLGDVVPLVQAASSTISFFAYVAPFIKGTMWSDFDDTMSVDDNSRVAAQVGRLLGACSINVNSSGMVDRFVKIRLVHILSKANIADKVMRARIEDLLQRADALKNLPLALAHWDVNARNILLDEDGKITGLLDWEIADLLPVGMNAWCIRFLSVLTSRGKDHSDPDAMEKAKRMAGSFWDAFINTLPAELHTQKLNIVLAMQIGFVLQTFNPASEPSEQYLSHFMLRIDWMKETFEPLCDL